MDVDSSREAKKAIMKDIILKLDEGLPVAEAKERFEKEIGTITSKVVLILGRFTSERKPILDAIRAEAYLGRHSRCTPQA